MMMKDEFILGQVQELMCELWQTKFVDTDYSVAARNIFEADMKKMWNDIESALDAMVEVDEINDTMCVLEEENADLINKNYELTEENERLKAKLTEISKVVNDTWC